MATLSFAIAIPLHRSARTFVWAHEGIQIVIGGISVGLGATMLYTQGSALLG
jgi:hypothetical protein